MARKKVDTPEKTDTRTGSRHKARAMVAMRPAIYQKVSEMAARDRRPTSWQIHALLIDALLKAQFITPAEAEELWAEMERR